MTDKSHRVLILGNDGYIGYPLTIHLLKRGYTVFGIDNKSRRRRVNEVGSNSLTPIASFLERKTYLKTFKNFVDQVDLHLGIDSPGYIKGVLETFKPHTIIHLAEQPSAPWSMKSVQHAVETQRENVIGTLHLLWAVKETCPEAHLIKLGTMGEYGCYDDKTEILTESGWILFSQLRKTDKVATRSKNDRCLRFKVPNSIHEYNFDGNMYQLKNDRLDIVVTPNHRMFTVKRSGSYYYGLREEIAEDIVNKPRVYDIGFEWEGEDREFFDVLGNKVPTNIWLRFLGWFLSEGTVEVRRDRPNPYRVIIKQHSKQSHETENCILNISNILNIPFHKYKENSNIDVFVLSGKDFASYMLSRFGRSKDKFIPQDIKCLSKKYLNILLGYLLAGDGWKHHRGFRYATVSKRLADDVQEITLKCGWAANVTSRAMTNGNVLYTVNISKSVYSHVNRNKGKFNDSWIPYKGKVYCVNVGGDGIIFVRRNGKPCWSGNTPPCVIPEGRIPYTCLEELNPGKIIPIENTRTCPMADLLFPRTAGSWYHLSKVHDTHNIEFACRNWGLRSTDIMQGVVFGLVPADDIVEITRFDYDEYFGTVINRFCTQALIGHPLTPYGKGGQTRGFLTLKDSITCLTIALKNPPKQGEYRTLNQFAITCSIDELATIVKECASELGLSTEILHIENPRKEMEEHYYLPVHHKLKDLGYKPTTNLRYEISSLLKDLMPYTDNIKKEVIDPVTKW